MNASPATSSRRFQALSCLLLLAAAVLVWSCRDLVPVGAFNDDAAYMLQANALAHGHSLFRTVEDPAGGNSAYMLGHAILLAPLTRLWGLNPDACRLSSVLMLLGCAVCVGWLAARQGGSPLFGLLVALLTLCSPAAVQLGACVMSDHSFACLTAALLVAAERWEERHPRLAFLMGLGAGFVVIVRLPGVVLAGLLLLSRWARRQFGESLFFLVGLAVAPLAYFSLQRADCGGSSWYVSQAVRHAQDVPWFQHLRWWTAGALSVWSNGYLGLTWGTPIVLLLVALAAWGAWRLRPFPAWLGFVVCYAGGLTCWIGVEARYFFLWWPLLIVAAAMALPARFRCALAASVLALALGRDVGLVRTAMTSPPKIPASYTWLREHTKPQDVIMSTYSHRVGLLSQRPAVPTRSADLYATFLETACMTEARYLLLDRVDTTGRDVAGHSLLSLPPGLPRWLQASTLVRRVYASEVDEIYAFDMPSVRFRCAYAHFLAASQADDRGRSEEAVHELHRALRLVPDFPEALSSLGIAEQKTAVLAEVYRRYPVYLTNAINLGISLTRDGHRDQAREVLRAALITSREIGDAPSRQAAERVLSQL